MRTFFYIPSQETSKLSIVILKYYYDMQPLEKFFVGDTNEDKVNRKKFVLICETNKLLLINLITIYDPSFKVTGIEVRESYISPVP